MRNYIPGQSGLPDRIDSKKELPFNRESIVIRNRVREPTNSPIYKVNILEDLFGDDRTPIYGFVPVHLEF